MSDTTKTYGLALTHKELLFDRISSGEKEKNGNAIQVIQLLLSVNGVSVCLFHSCSV